MLEIKIKIHKYPSNLQLEVTIGDSYGVIEYSLEDSRDYSIDQHKECIITDIVNTFQVQDEEWDNVLTELDNILHDKLYAYHLNQ